MTRRWLTFASALMEAIGVASLAAVTAAGQSTKTGSVRLQPDRERAQSATPTKPGALPKTPPKTPWGDDAHDAAGLSDHAV